MLADDLGHHLSCMQAAADERLRAWRRRVLHSCMGRAWRECGGRREREAGRPSGAERAHGHWRSSDIDVSMCRYRSVYANQGYYGTPGTVPTLCPAGFSCGSGATTPTPCPLGTLCPSGSGSPSPCAPGSYCPNTNSSSLAAPASTATAPDSRAMCIYLSMCRYRHRTAERCDEDYMCGSSVCLNADITLPSPSQVTSPCIASKAPCPPTTPAPGKTRSCQETPAHSPPHARHARRAPQI